MSIIKFRKLQTTNYKLQPNQGFTLVEMIVYIAIIGIVLVSFINFIISIMNAQAKTYSVQEVQSNGRMVLSLIVPRIRMADDVTSPTEGNFANTLVLNMPNPNPDLIFTVSSGVLTMAEGVGTPVAVTSNKVNVSNLTFTNLSQPGRRDNIKIELTIEYNNTEDVEYQYDQSWRTSVSLRR